MEKIAAASAMEWSIELEKALRSKNSARAVQAILRTGSRIEQWSREPEIKQAVCSMFGLVPGEDRLFANAILLRLADAFRFGDRDIRQSVVSIFLSNHRQGRGKKKRKEIKGILSKGRVQNHVELLRRVKVVFDTGDVESRALALVLFGCWADFAKDSAEIRYLILSSMVSSCDVEVKASFFAARCFCELVADFASVVLEMLVNMIDSSETAHTTRLAGAKVFSSMSCSYLVANRAYKMGRKLVLSSSEENFTIVLLVSLTKLVTKSTSLIPEQVDLLVLFLNSEKTWQLRATALRCLFFIFVKEGSHSPISAYLTKTLFSTLEDCELPPTMQCEALQILHKISLYRINDFPSLDTLDFGQLFAILEKVSRSSIMSESLLAVNVLSDVCSKLWSRTEMGSIGLCSLPLPSQIISLILEQIRLLVKPLSDICQNKFRVFQKLKMLFNRLLLLVREHPDLGVLLLDKMVLFIDDFINLHDNEMAIRQTGTHGIVSFEGERQQVIRCKILYYINRFMMDILQNLNEDGALTAKVCEKVKLLVECVHRCRSVGLYMHTVYSLLLYSKVVSGCIISEKKEASNLNENMGISLCGYSVGQEFIILEYAQKMLMERDNWHAYKAGIHAACEGAWFTATFIFEQLMTNVKSDTYYCWLKSLVLLSQSEVKVQLLLLPIQWTNLMNRFKMKKLSLKDSLSDISEDAAGNTNYDEVLLGAHYSLCSSLRSLENIDISGKTFCFQRWFLALRANVLGAVVDILKVLSLSQQDNVGNKGHVEKKTVVKSLQRLTQISFKLKRLAQEYDLISTSFIGMDKDSSKIIAALALSCSLLAFIAGFPLVFPNFLAYEIVTDFDLESSQQNYLFSLLLQHLVGRLSHMDHEMSNNICLLLDNCGGHCNKCFHLSSRNQIFCSGHEVREALSILRHAVSRMVCLQNEVKGMHENEIVSHVSKSGLKLLLDVIMKWIQLPFRIPKYFFRVRPFIGSELFTFSADTRNLKEIAVMPGFNLPLNLCLQLRNAPPEFFKLEKMYCLLYCRASSQKLHQGEGNTSHMQFDSRPWERDDVVEMNEKLFCHVMKCTKKTAHGKRSRDDDDCEAVYAFVCFEPVVKGQGFSNCLLDVSHFPVGSYRIKWYSCCIDSQGSYWSLLPLNLGPVFTISESSGS